jgi:hypothetical protein
LNSKSFLTQLLGKNSISYDFSLGNDEAIVLLGAIKNIEVLNDIAFSPIDKKDKQEILYLLTKHDLDKNKLKDILSQEYKNFFYSQKDKTKLMQNYINYIYEWIEIMNESIDKNTIEIITTKASVYNSLFWFYLSKKLYLSLKYNEAYKLIKFTKRNHIKRNNYLYEELSLYELISIKQSKDYFNNVKWQIKLEILITILEHYKSIQLTTKLELDLLTNNLSQFQSDFLSYKNIIFSLPMLDILNIFELAIYTKNKNIIFSMKKRIAYKNIYTYKNSKEFLIYKLLSSIEEQNQNSAILYIEKLRNKYDFKHLNWFAKKNNYKYILDILNAKS